MTETAQQYIGRMIGLVGERDALAILAATPSRVQALVGEASPRELSWTSSPTRWSIGQILAHLADAEIVVAWRLRSVLATDGAALQAFDQNVWASAFRYEDVDPRGSVAVFSTLRTATLLVLRNAGPARLAHAGRHEERGRETVDQITRMYAGHDLNHLGQIERLLEEARAEAGQSPV